MNLIILGINHGYQFIGEYPNIINVGHVPLDADIKKYQIPFFNFVNNLIVLKNVEFVFEEWTWDSESAWRSTYIEPII